MAADDADDRRRLRARTASQALLTRADHAERQRPPRRGLRRCSASTATTIVVNVQGDEPLIEPALIDACAALLRARTDCVMSTAAHAIDDAAEFANPNVVKVVLDADRPRAVLLARADPVVARRPRRRHCALRRRRRCATSACTPTAPASCAAFRRSPHSPLEAIEALEQLRVLWHGERIAVHVSRRAPGAGVDTPRTWSACARCRLRGARVRLSACSRGA